MTTHTGGQALVQALVDHGVDTVFGIPGTHNLEAYAALSRHGVRHISPRHEQGAGYAADGYARSTGRPGVVLTTTGPAILNAAAAAAQAYSDSVPILFISPGMPLRHPGRGNGLLHEIRDQSAAMEAIVGCSIRVASVEEIPLAVAQAFVLMTGGRPRPVHLEIPLDLLEATGDAPAVGPIPAGPTAARPDGVIAASDRLAAAERVVLVAGGGAAGAAPEVAALARRVDAAVLTTANGKGTVGPDLPGFVGSGLQHRAVLDLCDEADVVVGIGTEFAPSDWWIGLPDLEDKVIRIDVDATAIATNVVPAVALVGDAARTIEALLEHLPGPEPTASGWTVRWRERFEHCGGEEGAPWMDLMLALAGALPPETVVAGDNAMAVYYGALSNLPSNRPRSFLYPTGAGTLGYGLPAGVGAKVARPQVPVLVIQGDGGLMFSVAELAMAADLGIALPVLVVDNGGYGEIRNEMADRGDLVHAVALAPPDFPALARSLGCLGVTAVDAQDAARCVTAAFMADRPTLIHYRESSRATQAGAP